MHERRNPFSPEDERKARYYRAKYTKNSTGRQIDRVYALAVGPEDAPIYFYVGIAVDTDVRWKQHKRAIDLGIDSKPAYEYARYHKQRDTLRMVVLDPEGEFTEAEWETILRERGHPLQNVAGTVDVLRKKRVKSEVQRVFDQTNQANKNQPIPKMTDSVRKLMEDRHREWRLANDIDG